MLSLPTTGYHSWGDPAFALDTYQHVPQGMQAEVARTFEKLDNEARPRNAGRRTACHGRSSGRRSAGPVRHQDLTDRSLRAVEKTSAVSLLLRRTTIARYLREPQVSGIQLQIAAVAITAPSR